MEEWLSISLRLCVFGVLKEFRPSEPYVTKYLTNPPINLTDAQVSDDVYPVSVYTAMASLVLVFLLTDFLRYKPIIIFDTACAVVVFLMLLTVRSLFLVQVLEVFYGLFMAAEVAYYTYIYAKVDKQYYQKVSGHTRAAYLIGRTVSGIVSQIYVYFDPYNYYILNYFSLLGMLSATIWACFLPPVTTSIYFSRIENHVEGTVFDSKETIPIQGNESKLKKSIHYLYTDFFAAFSSSYIIKWMIWWALATCGYYQVLSYIQVLWEQILADNKSTSFHSELNGAVEAIYTLLSASASYGCGMIVLNWKVYGESVLFISSVFICIILLVISQTNSIMLAYGGYILYTISYNGMITIANSEIATHLNPDSHGLMFGFTLFMALVLESILAAIVNTKLNLDGRTQFVVYGCYFGFLALVFGIITIVTITSTYLRRRRKETTEPDA